MAIYDNLPPGPRMNERTRERKLQDSMTCHTQYSAPFAGGDMAGGVKHSTHNRPRRANADLAVNQSKQENDQ